MWKPVGSPDLHYPGWELSPPGRPGEKKHKILMPFGKNAKYIYHGINMLLQGASNNAMVLPQNISKTTYPL